MLDRFYWTDGFANFCANKFNTAKRFGVEGVQSFIPGMKALIDELSKEDGSKVICGMPHRGRLNFLANVVKKPLETIFAEF
jgi:2-oxoglutarate dehydrogenase E1 component